MSSSSKGRLFGETSFRTLETCYLVPETKGCAVKNRPSHPQQHRLIIPFPARLPCSLVKTGMCRDPVSLSQQVATAAGRMEGQSEGRRRDGLSTRLLACRQGPRGPGSVHCDACVWGSAFQERVLHRLGLQSCSAQRQDCNPSFPNWRRKQS